MADTRGTFRLKNVRQEVLNNEYVPIPAVWVKPSTANTGYFLTGGPSGQDKSMVDKIAYSTNTTARVPSANMATGRNYIVGGGSKTIGYCTGGFNGSTTFSLIEKITYATDTSATVSSPAGVPRQQHGVVGNSEKLYMVAGYQGPSGATSNITSFPFATETTSPSPSYPASQLGISGSGNQTVGYLGAGAPGGSASQVVKLEYSNDNNGLVPSSGYFTQTRKLALSAASSTGAYFAGGNPGPYSLVDKLTFATDNTARIPGANLAVASAYRGGTRSEVSAYWGSPALTCDIMPFETDTCSTLPGGANLSSSRGNAVGAVSSKENSNPTSLEQERWFDGASPPPNTGYSYEGSQGDTAYKTDLSSDTAATNPGAQQLTDVYNQASVSSSTAGYASGGQTSSAPSTTVSITQKTTYSSDTLARLPGANLPERINFNSGISDGTAGWYWGGHYQYPTSYNWTNIYKITYATEAMSTPGAQMTSGGNTKMSSTNSETAGYSAGGDANYTNVDKLVFSTETTSELPAVLPLHGNMYGTASIGTQTAGYWGGGASRTDVSKMTWATETAALTPSGFLSQGRNYMFSLGNTTDGYFCGGAPSPARTVDKLVYSTDTSAVSPSLGPSPMRNSQQNVGMGARAKGIPVTLPPTATPTASTFPSVNPALNVNAVFAAGAGPSSSTNQRSKLTFSNETMASMPSFADSQNTFGGASSTTRGYLSGSFGNTSLGDTQNKRWYNQYSNDTSGLLPSRTSQNAGGMYSMNDETKLYSGGGGWSGGQYNTAESMPFSNETNTGEPGMTLTSPKKFASGIGNKTIGFVCGGNEGNNNRTTIDKVVYSTGTMSTSPSNLTLSGASPYHATMAVGNTTTGFIFQNSPTNKLVFATETVSSAPTNNTANSWGNGTSSVTTGYVMNHPSGQYLIKYVFSTETTGTLPGMFSPNRGRGGAMSTAMFGGAYTNTPNVI